jgi:7-cyano-7-deazaguanine synthase
MGEFWGNNERYMFTRDVTLKALVRVLDDLIIDRKLMGQWEEEKSPKPFAEILKPWASLGKEFRTDGFYERFPAKGQLERVRRIHQRLVVRNEALRAIGGSALTDEKIAVPESHRVGRGIPVTYVPFRNAHFLAVAVSWAEVLDAEKVLIGAVEQDSSGYPDCRPAYYRAFNEVVKAGTKEGKIEVVTPLIGMRKAEIVRLGLELGAPFDLTWSCYSREDRGCGVCDSCVLRLRAFQQAGATDPIPYVALALGV